MTDDPLPATQEAKAFLVALSDYFKAGVDEITHEFKTKSGWDLKVTAKVISRPKEGKI